MINGLHSSGILYATFFSQYDPTYKAIEKNESNRSVPDAMNFYTFQQVIRLFDTLKVIHAADVIGLDLSHGEPHYHGSIEFMGQVVKHGVKK